MTKRLTELPCSSTGNKKAYDELLQNGMFDYRNFEQLAHDMHQEHISNGGDGDAFHIAGNIIDHFMQSHYMLRDSWNLMNPDQKWLFIEAMFYGIGCVRNIGENVAQG